MQPYVLVGIGGNDKTVTSLQAPHSKQARAIQYKRPRRRRRVPLSRGSKLARAVAKADRSSARGTVVRVGLE
jgi:hypothetical protein